jgi:hypothetical protein
MSSRLDRLRKVLERQQMIERLKSKFEKSEQDVVQQMNNNSVFIRVNEEMLIKFRFGPFLESKETFSKSILFLQSDNNGHFCIRWYNSICKG